MRIGIIAPSPVPYQRGGAENLFETLQRQINEKPGHLCELLKLPSREHGFFDLLRSYRDFMLLDVDHFDKVIVCKYPAWMVRHKVKIVYLQHTLRGLYDTWHMNGIGEDLATRRPAVRAIIRQLEEAEVEVPLSRERALALLDALIAFEPKAGGDPLFAFPGPLIRRLIHYLDRLGLSEDGVAGHFAISQTVADRKDYFPDGAKVSVLFHPSFSDDFRCEPAEHIFTASRLDGPKRIGLLIEAMRAAKTQLPLLIAGAGPDEAHIRALADGDPRIRFIGRVSSQELVSLYARSAFVPFIPLDEDYGLITLEAMKSAKPVLTVTDSGGPRELVVDGLNGRVVAPEVAALAEAIDALASDPEACRRMGESARTSVAHVNWSTLIDTLLAAGEAPTGGEAAVVLPKVSTDTKRKPQLVVVSTYPVWPPRGGGQTRIFHLYSRLAADYDVRLVTFAFPGQPGFSGEIASGLTEDRIAMTPAHVEAENALSATVGHLSITDIAMISLWRKSPTFAERVAGLARDAEFVVASHPYLAPMLRETVPGTPMWSDSHNFEYEMKKAFLPDTEAGRALAEQVRSAEGLSLREAVRVMACSRDDLDKLAAAYGNIQVPSHVVPNGVNLGEVTLTWPQERDVVRQLLQWPENIALFIGSWHPPNLEAAEWILSNLAPSMPTVRFHLVGSCCNYFNGRTLPENVTAFGVVNEVEKDWLLRTAAVALNPMMLGSGTNLKMFDYMASGLPVITTPFGARGMEVVGPAALKIASREQFVAALTDMFAQPQSLTRQAEAARAVVETHFDWDVIAARFMDAIRSS